MKKSFIIKAAVAAIVLTAVIMFVGSFVRGFREPKVSVAGDELIIDSSNGVTIAKNRIGSVRIINDIPTLTRTDGFGVGNFQRGGVRISGLGEGLAYIRLNNPPYIYLELNSGSERYVFLNLHDSDDTRELYGRISAWFQG